MLNLRISYKLLLSVCFLMLFATQSAFSIEKVEKVPAAARKLEAKADRVFIAGDYHRAMNLYRKANTKISEQSSQKLSLELKMARMYILLQEPALAAQHYDNVRSVADTLLTVNDVCYYIDALRQSGQAQNGEAVARNYAFRSPYNRDHRLLNRLNSLSDMRYYYSKGEPEFKVWLHRKSDNFPIYWIGECDSKAFYATGFSRIRDPRKIFYHQTKYYSFEGSGESMDIFKSIPRELQSGAVAFSPDGKTMIATSISYRNDNDRIKSLDGSESIYVTQLAYSSINSKRGGWSNFEPLFENQQGYNYAQPTFFNDGNSLVFSSDRSGGYGGMDLYVSHLDESTHKWGEPVNMGPAVNSEGDEIYPRIDGDVMYFSSTGHEGYGGYDIYRIMIRGDKSLSGTIYHYPYPINTSENDFGIFFNQGNGYFISDRLGPNGKDDIFAFDHIVTSLSNEKVLGVSSQLSAMEGNLNNIRNFQTNVSGTVTKNIDFTTTTYDTPAMEELLTSVYFDFDKYHLDKQALSALSEFCKRSDLGDIKKFYIVGYADELGTPTYNRLLSLNRANEVARYLQDNGFKGELIVEGRGQISLTSTGNNTTLSRSQPQNAIERGLAKNRDFEEQVAKNRPARRVEIRVTK